LVTDKPAPITTKLAQGKAGAKDGKGASFALMENNVSTAMLKNLVTDKPAPITTKLAQGKAGAKDGKGASFALMENNVSTAMLKNLVTDKPAPITTKLAQAKDGKGASFALMENNVSTAMLKNLVTDKPAPITTKLGQIEKQDQMKNLVTGKQALAQAKGEPIYVNPVVARDTMGDANLDMKILVGPDEVSLPKKKAAAAAAKQQQVLGQKDQKGVPVHVNPTLMGNSMGDADLGMNMRVGPDEVHVPKKDAKKVEAKNVKLAQVANPVVNPPFNNWSVNQPSPPHQVGLGAYQDLGQNIIVDGHHVHY